MRALPFPRQSALLAATAVLLAILSSVSVAAPVHLNSHGGAWSCKLTASGLPAWAGPWQQVACEPDKSFVVRVWLKGQGQTVDIRVYGLDWKEFLTVTAFASSAWSEASTPPFPTGDRTGLIIQVRDASPIDGNAYLDDLFAGQAGGPNRLANPGFEAGPSGWNVPAPFSVEPASPVPAHDGSWALRLAASHQPAGGGAQSITAHPIGRAITCSAWLKGHGGRVRLSISAGATIVITSATATARDAWTEVRTLPFTVDGNSRLLLRIAPDRGSEEPVWVDDVFAGIPGKANLLENPGFEYGDAFWSIDPPQAVHRADHAERATAPAAPPYRGPTGLHLPPGYRLVFIDDFGGTHLDRDRWMDHLTCYTDHLNDELERYRPYGVSVDGGHCALEARPAVLPDLSATLFSSGVIIGRTPFRHGYFEARIKLPPGAGMWPAFWLTSTSRWPPEWDILEVVKPGGPIYGYPHPAKVPEATCEWVGGASSTDWNGAHVVYGRESGAPDVNTQYVTCGFLWTHTDLTWYVDDVMTEHYRINEAAGPDDDMWLLLNLAVGGHWPGPPDALTPWPARMLVDYVKVWQPRPDAVPESRPPPRGP